MYHLQVVLFTPKIVGTFYMQGYKVKEKTAIVPSVSKLNGHPEIHVDIESKVLYQNLIVTKID